MRKKKLKDEVQLKKLIKIWKKLENLKIFAWKSKKIKFLLEKL